MMWNNCYSTWLLFTQQIFKNSNLFFRTVKLISTKLIFCNHRVIDHTNNIFTIINYKTCLLAAFTMHKPLARPKMHVLCKTIIYSTEIDRDAAYSTWINAVSGTLSTDTISVLWIHLVQTKCPLKLIGHFFWPAQYHKISKSLKESSCHLTTPHNIS